jgi:tetratricopeptide (TPR) repeat protein
MRRSVMAVFLAALLMLPVAHMAFADALTVQTDQDYYSVGSVVTIKGTSAADAVLDLSIRVDTIQVYHAEVKADSTGEYESTYTLPSDATLGIYNVTATSGVLSSEAFFTVTASSIGEIARQLIESAEGSQSLAGGTMRDIIALGYTVPAAANSEMAEGQEAVAESKSLHALGLYGASAEAATRAMRHFRNGLALSLGDAEGYEYVPSKNETLTHRIENLNDKLNQVSELIENLDEDDANLPTLTTLLESAESSLALASIKMEEGNYDEAAQALTAAQVNLQETMQLIKSNLNHYRRGLVAQFANRLCERIGASGDDLDQLNDHIQASYMNSATQRLGEANGLTAQTENRLQEGLDEDAINGLEEASSRLRICLGDLGNDDLSQGLIQLNMIRCQIQIQQGVAERLRRRGQDASTVEAQIQELQGLVNEGMRRMRMGDYSGANGLFGDAVQDGQYYGSGQGGSGSGDGGGGSGKGSGGGK